MAKPTAMASGTNSERVTPVIKNDGTNTARMESIASSCGASVALVALSTARGTEGSTCNWLWIASTATVASSTRMPTARARPPSVIILMVWPVAHSPTTAPSSANGMVTTIMAALRQSLRNSSTIRPVRPAPISPSWTSDSSEWVTKPDWSKASSIDTSGGSTARIFGRLALTSRMTASVEASACLVTGR